MITNLRCFSRIETPGSGLEGEDLLALWLQVPQSLDEAVNKLVALRLTEEKQKMEANYKDREAILLQRIEELEKEVAASKPSSAKGKKK